MHQFYPGPSLLHVEYAYTKSRLFGVTYQMSTQYFLKYG